jgi:dihydroorotate dehydrogenase electron transfer subunit
MITIRGGRDFGQRKSANIAGPRGCGRLLTRAALIAARAQAGIISGMNSCACAERPAFVQSQAVVCHQQAASSRYFLLRLHCPAVAEHAQPGQFIMLACTPDVGGYGEPLLPRPMAIMDARGGELELLYFVAGRGTELLHQTARLSLSLPLAQRPALRIIGPLGRPFTPLPGVDVHVALGGGSGITPLVFFFRRHAAVASPPSGARALPAWHLVLAARTADALPDEKLLEIPGRVHRATDDGSAGLRGTAVDALESLLAGELKGARVGLYAAGPEAMMRAAARVARRRGLPLLVSLESRMACGVGVCRACVVNGAGPHAKTKLLRRTVCQDGPVFDIDELAGW